MMDRVGVAGEDRRGLSEIFVGKFVGKFYISLMPQDGPSTNVHTYRRWIGGVISGDRRGLSENFVGKFVGKFLYLSHTLRWTINKYQ